MIKRSPWWYAGGLVVVVSVFGAAFYVEKRQTGGERVGLQLVVGADARAVEMHHRGKPPQNAVFFREDTGRDIGVVCFKQRHDGAWQMDVGEVCR